MSNAPVTSVTDELIAYYIEYHDSDAERGVPCSITEYEMAFELRQLREEREELKRDAERLEFVVSQGDNCQWMNIIRVDPDDFDSMRAAIDAAMQS